MLLIPALWILPICVVEAQSGPLQAGITDCTTANGNLLLTNTSTTLTLTVRLFTAAFRGFENTPNPACADVSYWELRSPTVIDPEGVEGAALSFNPMNFENIHLGRVLPDNFDDPDNPAPPQRPAEACNRGHLLSVSIDYADQNGTIYSPVVTSCSLGTIPGPVIAPTPAMAAAINRDLVMATGIAPGRNFSCTTGDCFAARTFQR